MSDGFTVTMDEKAMCDSDSRSREAWSLLSYLITKHRGDVNINKPFRTIWQDGIQDNPYNAFKTLVSWVRKMLEAAGFPSRDLILSQKGAYMWNPAWETEVDMDQSESLCRKALDPELDGEDMWETCPEAFELHKGIFLPRSTGESRVDPTAAYYYTLYQKLIVYMVEELIQDERYVQVGEICQRVVSIDRFAKNFRYCRIYTAYGQGEQETTLEQYKDTTNMFYRGRLMTPSEHFKELYKIISNSEREVMTDLNVIQENPGTGSTGGDHGVCQCEYAVFKRLAQLERRGVECSGDSVYLCLLTMGDRKGHTLKPEIQARAMERLRTSTQKSLRFSDVYARYSVSQLILLLSSATFEDSEMTMDRILSAFNKLHVRKDVAVNCSLNVLKSRLPELL